MSIHMYVCICIYTYIIHMYIQYTVKPPGKWTSSMFPSNGINKRQQHKKKKRQTWAPEFPNLGHAFQAIVQLPELSMVAVNNLQVNTPEVLHSSAQKRTTETVKGSVFLKIFPNFFRGKDEFHPQNQHASLVSTECSWWKLEEWSLFRDLRSTIQQKKNQSVLGMEKYGPFHHTCSISEKKWYTSPSAPFRCVEPGGWTVILPSSKVQVSLQTFSTKSIFGSIIRIPWMDDTPR